ncbi:hypothetical protein L21SP3_01693 [Sedimentisphaera cyanobacteriorum]|uniref:Dockerin domain-containing protein n=1 Tax=Sedimentisphaera cyanobacteriorum TaxID=1940790 RepID=A0A1Q2HRM0_9BACT|nr:hypothetical protein [Sedimentisphaera cyanobacteriorum]AQQ09873.1 hypothetical protein L21SP3_01693 [Sedimentisphaera cyanobacteriorum]
MRSIIFSAFAVFMAIGPVAGTAQAADIWADKVVFNWDGITATYAPGSGDNMTHGPFHSSALWNSPLAVLGKPNTLDRDDTVWNPPGGNFREINMVWPAWSKGTNDYSLDGTPYNSALTSNNGCGLKGGAEIVVEFEEIIDNNSNNPYGIDFIVHGNPFFATGIMVYEHSNMDTYTLSAFGGGGPFPGSGAGAVFSEPVTISVAQSLDGPWYTFTWAPGDIAITADNFFPTQPYKWDSVNHQWIGEELDWAKPVNPWIVGYFGNQTVADAIKLYAGSAGGTPFDLDWLVDEDENPVYLEWVKYIKFSDPDNYQGEICAAADVAPVKLGDEMSVAFFNLEVGLSQLDFVDPNDDSKELVRVSVWDMDPDNPLTFQTGARSDLSEYPGGPAKFLAAYDVNAAVILDPEVEPWALGELSLYVGDAYTGDANDLAVYQWTGEDWAVLTPSDYDASAKLLTVADVEIFKVFAVAPLPLEGDINQDFRVDFQDYAVLAKFWLDDISAQTDVMAHRADLEEDDFIDYQDLFVLADNWLECTFDCE